MKVVAEWFRRASAAWAGGIYQIGASFGAVFAPPLVAWAVFHHSWRAAFFVAGGWGGAALGRRLALLVCDAAPHARCRPASGR